MRQAKCDERKNVLGETMDVHLAGTLEGKAAERGTRRPQPACADDHAPGEKGQRPARQGQANRKHFGKFKRDGGRSLRLVR